MLMDFTWKSQKHWKKDYKVESFDYELRRDRKVGLALNYFFFLFFFLAFLCRLVNLLFLAILIIIIIIFKPIS